MNHTHAATRRTLLALLAALCLSAGAAAQTRKESPKETSKEFKPTRAQTAEAARLRASLAAALGDNFEIARDRLARRSTWHGGGLYWLAHLRATESGQFYVKYKYRYRDRAHPEDPLYTFVERQTAITVGPRGCSRDPRDNYVCAGDTVILPVVVNDYTEHAFTLKAEPYPPAFEIFHAGLCGAGEPALLTDPVANPAAEFLKYYGRHANYSPHREPGYTMTFFATFIAERPGSFNLALGLGAGGDASREPAVVVPVRIVERGEPVTVLSSSEYVRGYTERFSSDGGDNYPTTPVILQPGDSLRLKYHGYSRDGMPAPREDGRSILSEAKDYPPVITMLPFDFDPEEGFNEWLVGFLPPRAIMRPTKRGR
jgi:hypothetical protein